MSNATKYWRMPPQRCRRFRRNIGDYEFSLDMTLSIHLPCLIYNVLCFKWFVFLWLVAKILCWRPQALGYTLWFSLFSFKLNSFPFRASILTFSMQNHLILTYFTHFDTTHFFYKYYNIQKLWNRFAKWTETW
jgi:hypothetical protein